MAECLAPHPFILPAVPNRCFRILSGLLGTVRWLLVRLGLLTKALTLGWVSLQINCLDSMYLPCCLTCGLLVRWSHVEE